MRGTGWRLGLGPRARIAISGRLAWAVLWIILGGAGVAFVVAWLRPPAGAAPAAEVHGLSADRGAADERLALMQEQIESLKRQVAARATVVPTDSQDLQEMTKAFREERAKSAADAAELSLSRDDRAKLAAAKLFDKLDRELSASAPDPAWRPEAPAREAAGRFPGTRVDGVTCGPKHCRVELTFTNEDARHAVNNEIGTMEPFSSGVAFNFDPVTPLNMRLYFQRAGVPLGDGP